MSYTQCMMKKLRLTSDDRSFFALVGQAVLANPFGRERQKLDVQIAGKPPADVPLAAVLAAVRKRLAPFQGKSHTNISNLVDEDRYLVQHALLFDTFHEYMPRFDEVITKQLESEKALLKVPFAPELLAALRTTGFTGADAVRYLALFYQIRRAFFLISRGLVGRSNSMVEARGLLWNNLFTSDIRWYEEYLWNRMEDFSTLILGETGTGKGRAAAALGRSGFIPFDEKLCCFVEHFNDSFVSMNLSQYPETLIESELFGHRKGAFTGAMDSYKGIFSNCSRHGAIFLDEIGDVSIPIQIKLLQVLQERVYSPVGSHEQHRFNGRVIAATNRPLPELRRDRLFRDDFFYRLCSDVIYIPPLRQRLVEDPAELDDLVGHVLNGILGTESGELVTMIRDIIHRDIPKDYAWPGNVRELEQCIRRILLSHRYEPDHVATSTDLCSALVEGITSGKYDAQSLQAAYCGLLYNRHGTYEEVARRTKLDRRTVKKYITASGTGANTSDSD